MIELTQTEQTSGNHCNKFKSALTNTPKMYNIPTFRRGRRTFTRGPKKGLNQQSRVGRLCALIGTFLLVLIPLLLYIHVENQRFKTYIALTEISNSRVVELPTDDNVLVKPGDIVHGSSRKITSTVTDPALGMTIDNALTLNRNTEYCQWREIRRESCRRCSRTVRNEDGTRDSQNYECDCTVQYDYVKGWQPYLINCFLFDQPAAHYNPQRDPLPSSYFVAQDASVIFTNANGNVSKARLSSDLLLSRVRGATTRAVNWVYNGIPKPPPLWLRWIPDRSRYEDLSSLEYLIRFVPSLDERFTYVGDGYFFSSHETSKMEKLMQVFGEYLEGTLFDWQFGDIFPSCTAGDIRIKYTVQDPQTVSVLGEVGSTSSGSEICLQPITSTSNDLKVGFVREGIVSASTMIENENSKSRSRAMIFRLLSIGWSFFISRRLCFIAGYDVGKTSIFKQILTALSFWSFLTGIILSRVWGSAFEGNVLTSLAIVAIVILFREPPPHVSKKRIVKEYSYKESSECYGTEQRM